MYVVLTISLVEHRNFAVLPLTSLKSTRKRTKALPRQGSVLLPRQIFIVFQFSVPELTT